MNSMKKYYLILNNNKSGPYSLSDLESVEFDKNTLVWHSGLTDWIKAENIEDLSNILKDTPPPIPQKEAIQNIRLESPINVNLAKESHSKEKIEEKSRNFVKKGLSEIGILLIIFVGTVFFSFISYQIVLDMNKPNLISSENQQKFNSELFIRNSTNQLSVGIGDIAYNYLNLGEYKYDVEISMQSQLEDINTTRLTFQKEKSEEIAWYIFYITLGLVILIRYLTLFIKWLNPVKSEIDNQPISKISNTESSFVNNTTENSKPIENSKNEENSTTIDINKYEYFDVSLFIEDEKKNGRLTNKESEINYILDMQGLEEELILEKVVCKSCKSINSITNDICDKCGENN